MASGREIALQVFPVFAENVLARRVMSYGAYAKRIGRDPVKEAITIGPAMHVIGAVCVVRQLPVAPLYFVKTSDGEGRQIFAADRLEAKLVLPHFDTLLVASREYKYTREELEQVEKRLRDVLVMKAPRNWTPHHLWHMALVNKPKDSVQTYFERAREKYRAIIAELRHTRKNEG